MSKFKPHDYFETCEKPYISREVFQDHVRKNYDNARELYDMTEELQSQTEQLHIELEENELARETAESVRMTNEEERISKDSERDSKIYSLEERVEENEDDFEQHKLRYVEQVEVPITQLLENGDFSEVDGDGTPVGWRKRVNVTDFRVEDEGVYWVSPNTSSSGSFESPVFSAVEGHKYYLKCDTLNVWGIYPMIGIDTHAFYILRPEDSGGSVIYTEPESSEVRKLQFRGTTDMESYLGKVININLTQTFGVGNEPTKEEMDELIELIGWFDGTITLTQKQQLIWTLNLIRKNRNAITALGGGIV